MYEQYKLGIDVWRKRYGNNKYSVATLAIASGTQAVACDSTICHAGLNSREASSIKDRDYVVSGLQNTFLNEGQRQMFLEWLVQRSPFESAFPVKDVAWQIDQGCLIGSAHVPANLLAAALIASRFCSEDKNMGPCRLMMGMVAGGVDEDVAFVVAHYVRTGKTSVSFYPGDNCHSVLMHQVSIGYVSNFLRRDYKTLRENYSKTTGYSGVFELFKCECTKPTFPSWLTCNFKLDQDKEDKGIKFNPFLKSKVAEKKDLDKTYPRHKFIDTMSKFQDKIYAEVGYDKGIHHQQQLAV